MRNFITGLLIGVTILACSAMGGKSIKKGRKDRLVTPIDDAKTPWEFCTPKMVSNYRGKLCLVQCELKLEKDGTCKKDKYKYVSKDLKAEHGYFMNRYIAVPENGYY